MHSFWAFGLAKRLSKSLKDQLYIALSATFVIAARDFFTSKTTYPQKRHAAYSLAGVLFLMQINQSASALQITDDRRVAVTFTEPPQRIVSLLPSLSESVCALGQCQRLVGVDRYSNFPDRLKSLPKVGGGIDPNVEAIAALKPDVVLVYGPSHASEQLESLGIKVVALQTNTHADVQRVLSVLGVLLAIPPAQGADRVWRGIDSRVSAVSQALPVKSKSLRVYFEASTGPYAASEASFIGETLTRLGVKNVVPAKLGPFPRLNPEYVVRADPDVIMISSRGIANAAAYPGWHSTRAVKNKRVCVFSNDDADVLVRPGPRMAEAAQLMAKCLARYE